jgi:hypothetical protein
LPTHHRFHGRHFMRAFIMHCSILPIAANIASASRRLSQGFRQQAPPVASSALARQRIAPPPIPEQQSDWFPPRNATNTRTELEKSRRASPARGSPATDFIGLQALKAPFQPTIEPRANKCPARAPRCPAPPLPTQACPNPQCIHPHTQLIRRTLGIQSLGAARPLPYHPTGFRLKSRKENRRKQREVADPGSLRSMALLARAQFLVDIVYCCLLTDRGWCDVVDSLEV